MKQMLPHATPESLGIPSAALEQFYKEIEVRKMPMHSFMLLRHGKIATQGWWAPHHEDEQHIIYSVSKSFTSIAVGLCIEEGRFTLDSRVVDFFPEKIDFDVHPDVATMTVRNLLTMTSGHHYATDHSKPDWVKTFLMTPPEYKPGTLFGYDSTATHTLCAIVQKVTGMKMMDYLKPRLFDPLGIEDIYCQECPMGINAGSRGIHCRTLDMAKFGQLVLQKGVWKGKQLIPSHWIEEATKKQVDTSTKGTKIDGNRGYGYQFWRLRDDAFAGIGSGGQLIVMIPSADMVWVSTANLLNDEGDYELIVRLFWATIFPFLSDEPLPENPMAHAALIARAQALQMLLPDGQPHSPIEPLIDGKCYRFDPNQAQIETISFAQQADGYVITVHIGGKDWVIHAGRETWIAQHVPVTNDDGWARYTFVDDHTMVCQVQLALKLGTYKFVMAFLGDTLNVQLRPTGWTDFHRINLLACGVAQ